MSLPTKPATFLRRDDVIGYEGRWRRVRALTRQTDTLEGEVVVVAVAWEEGGFDRFPAEAELLLKPAAEHG
ncbi:hypothetical protein [Streptomyces sp. NBC_01294]|uniref:hypothetical protein n=1 Tax=Streptomyces sp. NBC_01294 TaxID=2903815 RepID=UPI002DD8B490|nr:hypothetical protein [Streptomyces sp. NBC_01294]WRZ62308.1 hypothetical protein OG534_38265 [Streptomyces sp. NBC_01294]